MSNTPREWKHLERRPGSSYRQLCVKGKHVWAWTLYCEFMNVKEPRTPQQLADRLFQALARWSDTPADLGQDTLWDGALLNQAWLAVQSQAAVSATPARSADAAPEQQGTDKLSGSDHAALVDQVFAQLADETDDFSDFGDN